MNIGPTDHIGHLLTDDVLNDDGWLEQWTSTVTKTMPATHTYNVRKHNVSW